MAKSESPVLRMTIERGRLVPATAFDQERIDTYRHGSEVRVQITQERNAKLLRKFFAIIGRVVKDCFTPWQTKDQAVEALKLALGIVETGKTISGNWFQYPRSLTELDEPEFVEFYEQAMALLHKITGVDPLTLGIESADVGDDLQSSPEDATPPPSGDEVDASGDVVDTEGGVSSPGPALEPSQSALGLDEPSALTEIEHSNLVQLARMMSAAIGPVTADLLYIADNCIDAFPKPLTAQFDGKAKAIIRYARNACDDYEGKGRTDAALARRMIAGVVGVDERELA